MDSICQIALSNAVLVAAGAPIVWLVGRYANRPALTHGLAVVLLLKLITPPLFRVPISWPEEPTVSKATVQKDIARTETVQPTAVTPSVSPVPDLQMTSGTVVTESTPAPMTLSDPTPTAAVDVPKAPIPARLDAAHWIRRSIPILGWIWIAGCALCGLVAITRILRFTRALRFATRARDVQPRADLMARRLGLVRSPAVWFVPAFISPMLWSLGRRPRLLLPQGLWDRLDIAGRDTILLHELAHWRRGDHWVRWIELLATCLYWWHPACWWARRELREAEEQCCDAWVLWAMPGIFKNYANALLEAVEFASIGADRPSARRAVPALASRMGQFVHLRRRLTMLKHGNISRALSWGGLAGVMTLGSVLLPLTPTWGQEQPAQPDEVRVEPATPQPTPAETAPGAPSNTVTPAPVAPGPTTPPMTNGYLDQMKAAMGQQSTADEARELAQARQTIAQLERELRMTRDQMKMLEARVNAFQAWQKVYPRGNPSFVPDPPTPPLAPAAQAPRALPAPEQSPYAPTRPDAPSSVYVVPQAGPTPSADAQPGIIATPAPPFTVTSSSVDGQYRVTFKDPTTGRIKVQTRSLPPGFERGQSESERLDRIEVQLRMMMDEITQMRQANAAHDYAPAPTPAQR